MHLRAPSILLFLSVSSVAPQGAVADEGIQKIVVTATRTEQPVARIGSSITRIEPAAIQASQPSVVSDLLATTPGVTISRNGGLGGTTALRIRGAESDHTVVLIDGVKLNDPSSPGGGYNFANLLAGDIARIEVLRGPQSTLWGSQAIGGVVNVVTPVPSGPLAGTFSAEAGSRETGILRASAQAGSERFGWRVGGNYLTTEGISAFAKSLGGAEKDGYRNLGLNVRAVYRFTDDLSAEVSSVWSDSRSDFDGFPPPAFAFADTNEYGTTRELVSYAGLNLASFEGRWRHRLGFAYTDTDRDNYDPDSSVRKTFDAAGRNERLEYQGTIELASDYELVVGLESERSRLRTASPSEFDPDPVPLARSVRLDSAFAQIQATPITALTLTAGLRYDDHDEFGGASTASAALAWAVAEGTTVRASYGEGFKAPTLFQLYSDYGNAALQPEEAQGWDGGIEQRLLGDALIVSATYFERDTTNMIDFVSCFGSTDPRCGTRPFGFYDNVQKTKASGVELALAARAGERVHFSANYTHLDAENAAAQSANFGRMLARRARDTANAALTVYWPAAFTTTIAARYSGKSFDDAANDLALDSYTLVDLRASYALSERTELFGRVENVFDEEYQTVWRYGSVSRGTFLGLRTSF